MLACPCRFLVGLENPKAAIVGRKLRVLAVDDDPVILELYRVNLELEGHAVFTAASGQEALEVAGRERPDVVILDIMMPDMDGWEVLERMRGDRELRKVPVVFVTARAHPSDVRRGLEMGAAAYLTKPFDPEELLEVVARAAEGAGGGRPRGRGCPEEGGGSRAAKGEGLGGSP